MLLRHLLQKCMESDKYKDIEIIFVSSDRSENDMISYMKESHGSWLAVEHESQISDNLSSHFSLSGIPTLIVMKKNADDTWSMVTKDGRAAIQSNVGCEPEKVMAHIFKN